MEKYLKRLCAAIIAGRFDDKNFRQRSWYGKEIMTEPLFCSYGAIGFTVSVFDDDNHFCTVQWDGELHEMTIDYIPWKRYINELYLENNDINSCGEQEFECYTDAGGDMIFTLEEVTKECLKQYIDGFDINEEVMIWWSEGADYAHGKGVPFDNIREHYEDYESFLKRLQKICNKMPF